MKIRFFTLNLLDGIILPCFYELGTWRRKIFCIMSCVGFTVMGELPRMNKHEDRFIKVPSHILSSFWNPLQLNFDFIA